MSIEEGLRGSIFTEPAAWAVHRLTKRSHYRSFQALCVAGALLGAAAVWVPASRLGLTISAMGALFLPSVLFSCLLPLAYLRAARALVLERSSFSA